MTKAVLMFPEKNDIKDLFTITLRLYPLFSFVPSGLSTLPENEIWIPHSIFRIQYNMLSTKFLSSLDNIAHLNVVNHFFRKQFK